MKLINNLVCITLASSFALNVWAIDAVSLEKQYAADAKQAPSVARGEKFFRTTQGKDWSCASCHGAPPIKEGRHITTDKPISPLAPAFNPKRFVDESKVNKWFKRNCNDVLSRECSSLEKADVMAYLNSLK